MNEECSQAAGLVNLVPENTYTAGNTSMYVELDNQLCDYFHDFVRLHPGANLGKALSSYFLEPRFIAGWASDLNLTIDEFKEIWADAPPLELLEKMTTETGWNGCQSQRFKPGRDPNQTHTIRKYSPKPYIEVQLNGIPSTQGFADFGGHSPEVVIRDRNPAKTWEWTPLAIEANLGVQTGRWDLYNIQLLSGGSRRVLDLEITLDGVPAGEADDSWWEFDNEIEFVNPYSLSFGKMSILFLTGHDAFRLFAVLTIPLMFLNVRGRNRRAPGLVASGLALPIVLLFQW